MKAPIKPGFQLEVLLLPLDKLLPTKAVSKGLKHTSAYQTVAASVRELCVNEPLRVYPHTGGMYLLLDGHVRLEVLRDLQIKEAYCIVATSDEAYVADTHVNAVPPIQQQRMIGQAIDAGVSDEKIARALNRSADQVRRSQKIYRDICPEAIDLLKDKDVALETIAWLRKVKPLRQIEMAEVMTSMGRYSATYARCLVQTTPKDQLVDPDGPKPPVNVKPEDLARLENAVRTLETSARALDETYNENIMALTIARGYLRKLLQNARVVAFLAKKRRDLLEEFQRLAESKPLEMEPPTQEEAVSAQPPSSELPQAPTEVVVEARAQKTLMSSDDAGSVELNRATSAAAPRTRTPLDTSVLELLRRIGSAGATAREILEALKATPGQFRGAMERLRAAGAVKMTGERSLARYFATAPRGARSSAG